MNQSVAIVILALLNRAGLSFRAKREICFLVMQAEQQVPRRCAPRNDNRGECVDHQWARLIPVPF
jgi:hypothetical protein